MVKRTVFICIALLLLLPGLIFAGNQTPEKTGMATGSDEPMYGGTLTINGGQSEPPSPAISDGHHASLAWLEFIQERIIHGDVEKYGVRGNGEYAFQLVAYIPPKYQKGHLISDWDLTKERLIWTVREGIMWQAVDGVMDARPLTADDIAKDIQRFVDSPWGGRFNGLLKSVKAEGNKVILEYDNYSPELFYFVGYEDRAIISPEETEIAGAEKWENQGGTGAFAFEEYVVGSYMSYKKNPNYWDSTTIDGKEYQMPFVDRVVRVIFPDEATTIAALRTAAVDHAGRSINAAQWESIESTSPDLKRNLYGDMVQAISLKTDEPPFDDVNVRRALSVGTNFEAFKTFGKATAFPTHVFPAWSGNPSVYTPMEELPADVQELYKYDAAKAKKMLADAGYPSGFEMDFFINSEDVQAVGFASLLQNEWGKLGVKVNIIARDYVTYRQYRDTFTFTGAILAGTEIGNATGSVINLLGTDGWLNYSKYSNAKVDELAAKISGELDPVKQNAMIKEAAVIAAGEVANIGAYLQPQGTFWWPWVKNFDGEQSIEDGTFGGLVPYIWIDQKLKKEMGY